MEEIKRGEQNVRLTATFLSLAGQGSGWQHAVVGVVEAEEKIAGSNVAGSGK